MDLYSKGVLTVIAVCLVVIALKQWEPKEAHAGVFDGTPTVGDLMELRDIKDPTKRQEAAQKIMRRVPLVRIQGGSVSVD